MIIKRIQQSIELKTKILSDEILIEKIRKASELIIQAYRSGNKTLFCGNGGSAADAQHLAAELSGKFYLDRAPIHAEACQFEHIFHDCCFERLRIRDGFCAPHSGGWKEGRCACLYFNIRKFGQYYQCHARSTKVRFDLHCIDW